MWDGAGSAFVQVQAAPAALDGGQQQQWPTSLKLEQRQGSQGAAVGLQPANSEGASPRVKTSKPGRGAHPAVCQVCGVSVAALKEYYVRYRICELHRSMDQMVRSDGEIQRFCQQCGRFHHISAFDDNKRSCRERLARHNERRRRRPVSEPLAGSKRPSGSPADLEASNSGHSIDNSWAQQQHHRPTFMADMPVNYIHPSMDIWQQRQMQLQAMQLQDHQSMAATGSHSLSAPYNIMTSGASNFPSDLGTSHFSDGFAQYSLMGQQSLHQPHSSSHVLTFHSHADANLHAAMPGLSAIAGIPHLPVVPVAAATGAAEHRAPRKTLSWPLMQIKLGDVAAQEQHGLITGASRNFGVHHQTYGDEAMLMMQHAASVLPHGTAVHNDRPFPAPRAGDGMMLHQSEIRVLGENQTLDAILENIMLLDEPDGV